MQKNEEENHDFDIEVYIQKYSSYISPTKFSDNEIEEDE